MEIPNLIFLLFWFWEKNNSLCRIFWNFILIDDERAIIIFSIVRKYNPNEISTVDNAIDTNLNIILLKINQSFVNFNLALLTSFFI